MRRGRIPKPRRSHEKVRVQVKLRNPPPWWLNLWMDVQLHEGLVVGFINEVASPTRRDRYPEICADVYDMLQDYAPECRAIPA